MLEKRGRRDENRDWRNPGFGQSGRHPVVCIGWNDAQAYAAWLSRKTSEEYRLPSESEWEYAARASTVTARYWGDGESGQHCRHANSADSSLRQSSSDWPDWLDQSSWTSCQDGHVHTAPVGSFAPNRWGLHDMLGNVDEWTGDCYMPYRSRTLRGYAEAPADGSAWEDGDCDLRRLRGGSWYFGPKSLRSASRSLGRIEDHITNDIGFRVVRALAP